MQLQINCRLSLAKLVCVVIKVDTRFERGQLCLDKWTLLDHTYTKLYNKQIQQM